MSEAKTNSVDEKVETERFRPLGQYAWPDATIDRSIKRVFENLVTRRGDDLDEGGMDDAHLIAVDDSWLDRVAAGPASASLAQELDATLADWLATDPSGAERCCPRDDHVRTVVLPPCDPDNFLGRWASDRGHVVIEPPPREKLLDADDFQTPADHRTADTELLVIPRLEDWFLRDDVGLAPMRKLVSHIGESRGRWLIGCNSWAWQFLAKSCRVDAVLPEPLVPAAFGADRLRHWLQSLSAREDSVSTRFRLASSGQDVFSNKDKRGRDEKDTLAELAALSLGIPWIAHELWRDSLRMQEEVAGTDDDDTRPTLWISGFAREFAQLELDRNAMLVLHTLLVHGRLRSSDVYRSVPVPPYLNSLAALRRSGLVVEDDGLHACVPSAYPVIRDRLRDAGYPMDVL